MRRYCNQNFTMLVVWSCSSITLRHTQSNCQPDACYCQRYRNTSHALLRPALPATASLKELPHIVCSSLPCLLLPVIQNYLTHLTHIFSTSTCYCFYGRTRTCAARPPSLLLPATACYCFCGRTRTCVARPPSLLLPATASVYGPAHARPGVEVEVLGEEQGG